MILLNRDKIHDVVAGCDFGYEHAGVLSLGAIDYDGRVLLFHQVFRTKKLIDWWVAKAVLLHDYYDISAIACDPSEPAYIRAFRNAHLPAFKADNEVEPGIQRLAMRLVVQADGLPRFLVYSGCVTERDPVLLEAGRAVSSLDEFPSYIRNPVTGKPVKENDDGLDSIRYMISWVDRKRVPVRPPTTEQLDQRAQAEAERLKNAQEEYLWTSAAGWTG